MASKSLKQQVHEALEPTTMAVPVMDRPSVALAWFMDNIGFDVLVGANRTETHMVCSLCMTAICEVSDGDSLRVMFNTALAHGC